MRTTIDKAGRVVIPAAVRERAGLSAGSELEVTEDELGEGIRFLYGRAKLACEPAGAAAVAALLAGRIALEPREVEATRNSSSRRIASVPRRAASAHRKARHAPPRDREHEHRRSTVTGAGGIDRELHGVGRGIRTAGEHRRLGRCVRARPVRVSASGCLGVSVRPTRQETRQEVHLVYLYT